MQLHEHGAGQRAPTMRRSARDAALRFPPPLSLRSVDRHPAPQHPPQSTHLNAMNSSRSFAGAAIVCVQEDC